MQTLERQTRWRNANRDKYRKYQREWNHRNLDKLKILRLKSHEKRQNIVNKIKSQPCADCGLTFPPICMDFDHRDPKAKKYNISRLVKNFSAISKVMQEINKCDVVCSNCHRLRTQKQYLQFRGSSVGFEKSSVLY